MLGKRRWIVLALLILAGIGVVAVWKLTPRREPAVFTTQRSGEPPVTWHIMHTLWTCAPVPNNWVSELVADTTHLYYCNAIAVGCLDKVSGRCLWRFSLAKQGDVCILRAGAHRLLCLGAKAVPG